MGFREFLKEEDGIGTVEVVLILAVIVALVVIFRGKIKTIVNNALQKITSDSNKVIK
ncbi:MAG: hypothetical protein DUD27_02800 [Lachnospiraceae bacterium]|uniref:Putative Flagellin Flp1-like domain-containing protein n=1 Tax=Candidatus Weimeria bifida TaxID=2599074 RepID=A0A6N7J0D8_9FIRM|nr:hypothetical protein [Candidatus Weimeria bifida]RRF96845.1 MAG: hypothetical protein DUD27_02800 [Lachnospiraceae bacterium]